MSQLKPLGVALAAAGVLVVGTAGAISLKPAWLGSETPAAVATPAMAAAVPALAGSSLSQSSTAAPNYREIVQQSGPAVVGVTVAGTHKATAEDSGLPPGAESDPFFQFFRGLPGQQGRGQQGRPGRGQGEAPFRGQGSGFIISSDGLILTNAHVVRDAKEVTVKLSDRREYSAKVLGADTATDIAVLRIEAKGLPIVRLGNPKNLEVGDPVLAIGSPFGFEQTATQGIVSAKGRSLPGDAFVPFIQTDAAVNPGNSGGPLFDGSGSVVGINAQIYSQSGGYQGLSFAIPIDVALKVKDQIVTSGKASHARLGVVIQDLNQTLAESFGLPKPDGALVSNVAADTPAAKAGLKAGDVITQVNGEPIIRSGSLSSRIGLSSPGDKVKLTVWREGSARDMDVTLATVQDSEKTAASKDANVQPGSLGLSLRSLTKDERAQVHVEQGLVVEDVAGPAARAGIQEGDVLLAVNGKPLDSVEQLRGVLQGKPKSVALLVVRDGERIFVPVNLG
ncbi:DegQ family serine endoprotease [soil metagenome]